MQSVFEFDDDSYQNKIYTEIHTKIVSPTGINTPGVRRITISTGFPSGGNNGDIWIQI